MANLRRWSSKIQIGQLSQQVRMWKIRQKIGFGYLVSITVGFLGAIAGMLVADYYQGQGIQQLTDAQVQAELLVQYQSTFKQARLAGALLLAALDHPTQLEQEQKLLLDKAQQTQQLRQQIEDYLQRNPAWLADDATDIQELLEEHTNLLDNYIKDIQEITAQYQVNPIARVKNELRQDLQNLTIAYQIKIFDPGTEDLAQLIQQAQRQARQAEIELEAAQGLEKGLIVFSSLLAVAIAGYIAFRTTRHITDPLEKLASTAKQVATQGNFSLRVEETTQDEIGSVAQDFNFLLERVSQYTSELIEAKNIAEQANKAKSTFLATMSHELRTPLNAILGFAQLLSYDPALNPSQKEQLTIINRSGEHLLTLINDILSLAKIESGNMIYIPKNLDLYDFLEEIKTLFLLKADSKNLCLEIKIHPDTPQYIQADEGKLRQVFINLIGNALKFTEVGQVTLQVEPAPIDLPHPQKNLTFSVADTGAGIAPDELATLFEAFTQTETGLRSQQGTGLGLTISQGFIEQMGGQIRVESTVGIGTKFFFTIPVKQIQSSELEQTEFHPPVIGIEDECLPYRILIVEDKWENRQLLFHLLTPLKFELKEAVDGVESLEICKSWHPDLILMDIAMPRMNGYEATKEIRRIEKEKINKGKLQSTSTIIALTASVFEEERAAVLASGCDDFLSKPFRDYQLFKTISTNTSLRFIYADINLNDNAQSGETIQAKELLIMSQPWLKEVYEATIAADAEMLEKLIQDIPKTEPNLSQYLMDLVYNFQFDIIADLLDEVIEE